MRIDWHLVVTNSEFEHSGAGVQMSVHNTAALPLLSTSNISEVRKNRGPAETAGQLSAGPWGAAGWEGPHMERASLPARVSEPCPWQLCGYLHSV